MDEFWLSLSFALVSLPLRIGGAAALFTCFWPGMNPIQRLRRWVLWPALLGLVAVCARLVCLARSMSPEQWLPGRAATLTITHIPRLIWEFGPGLHYTLAGFVFLWLAVRRVQSGRAVLPIHLESSALDESAPMPKNETWQRVFVFVWMAIVLPIPWRILSHSVEFLMYRFWLHPDFATGRGWGLWLSYTTEVFWIVTLLGASVWAMGRERRRVLREAVRMPPLAIAGLGLLLPVGVGYIVAALLYLWHFVSPSQLITNFWIFPGVLLFRYLPAALAEEIGWRGYLQPRFICRFGLLRGIVLVGIVWGAFHFGLDFTKSMGHGAVLLKLATRVLGTVILSFPLAWLTLRSGSVIPAGLMHATYNVFVSFPRGDALHTKWLLLIGFSAVMGIVLFCYWAPRTEDDRASSGPPPSAEPAT